MASNIGTLTVFLNANTAKFNKKMARVNKSFFKMQRIAKFAGLAAAAAMTKFSVDSVKAFTVQEDAIAQLNQTLKSTNFAAGFASKELQKMAADLQSITTFGDEAIIKTQALLATFTNIKGDVFKQATLSILDMSTALGQDLKSSAVQLGKALNDPVLGITALSRVGIAFTDKQKKSIKDLVKLGKTQEAQLIILAELQKEFGGQAEAAAKTTSGRIKQMVNQWGDLQEAVGGVITKILDIESGTNGAKGFFADLTASIKRDTVFWVFSIKQVLIEIKFGFKQSFVFAKNIISDITELFKTAGKNIINIVSWVFDNFSKFIKNILSINQALGKEIRNIYVFVGEAIVAALSGKDIDFTGFFANVGKELERSFKKAGITELKILSPELKGIKGIIDDIERIDKERLSALTNLEKDTVNAINKTGDEFKKISDGGKPDIKAIAPEKTQFSAAVEKGTVEAYRAELTRGTDSLEDTSKQTAKNTKSTAESVRDIANNTRMLSTVGVV